MKGLELARGYFYDECLPRLRKELPAALPYLAAGLVGEGSDCFGYDDFISRDHDWGPAFCLWLPQRYMEEYADGIKEILASLPQSYKGLKARDLNSSPRVGLCSVEGFYASLIGCPRCPESAEEWLSASPSGLAAAVNGEVFLDNSGEFTAVREALLGFYPEDVRVWLLAKRCALAAQTGQYNYLRCLRHGEKATAEMIKGRFGENAMAAMFLLNGRYMPFYKWSHRALATLPEGGAEAAKYIERIMFQSGTDAIADIEAMSGLIIAILKKQSLSNSGSDFLMDHCGELIRGIKDASLRSRGLTLDF